MHSFHKVLLQRKRAVVRRYSSNCLQMSYKSSVLKQFAIFAGKHLCWSLFLINFVKRRLQHRCFPVNIAKFLRTAFWWNTSGGCFYMCSIEKMFRKISQTSLECIVTGVLFLSSCRARTCNFVKIEGLVQVFCCKFSDISQNIFMQNNFERLLLDVKRCWGVVNKWSLESKNSSKKLQQRR